MVENATRFLQYLFASTSRPELTPDALPALAQEWAQRNVRHGITGFLMRAGERHLQLLEGPEFAVRRLKETIARDGRHQGMTRLIVQLTDERAIPDEGLRLSILPPEGKGDAGTLHRQIADAVEGTGGNTPPADLLDLATRYLG
jgi:hypothetical protein